MRSIESLMCSRLDEIGKGAQCLKRRVACVLVKNNYIVSEGNNGSRNCFTCLRETAPSGEDLHKCRGVHAEIRALFRAGFMGRGCTMYITHFPCSHCAPLIVEAAIEEVVYINPYGDEELTRKILEEAGIKIRRMIPDESS